MALFHLSAQPISRAAGRSATAAAAYRAGVEITDERTGQVHDYSRKGGVMHSEIILPRGGTADRAEFWNRIEKHHKRGDAVLCREVEVSLPTELTKEERRALAVGFARELADRYGVAADVALHAPRTVTDKDLEKVPDQYYETDPATGRRHNGNWHAHIMLSACHVSPAGDLGKKAVELDPIHCQRAKIENMADRERVRWAHLANGALERAGHSARVDYRSLADQGIDRAPSIHLGPSASAIERRGEVSQKTENHQARQAKAASEVAALTANSRARVAAALKAAAQQTADALKQIQASALAAEQAHAAAIKEAEKQAAQAHAQREADELAKAKQQALDQARALAEQQAIQIQLKEKEDDRVREAALAAIDSNVRDAGTAWEGTVSAVRASAGSLNASRRVADSNGKIVDRIGRNTESAIQGAERRVARNHLESCSKAVGKQLGGVNHVLQQLVDRLPNIVKTIDAAARAVARQVAKRLAKTPGQPQQATQTLVKTNAAKPPEKPPEAVFDPALTDADRKLITRLDDLIDRAAQGDQKAMDSLTGAFSKLDDAKQAAQSDYGRAKPQHFHWPYAEQAAKDQREEAAKLDVNAAAAAERGVTAVPYPPGMSGQWAAEHYSSYETALKKAVSELGYHSREPRPEGFWKKKETAAYDAKTAELQSKVSGWEKEIGWRDEAFNAATREREQQEAAHVVRAKARHDQEQTQNAAKAEPLRARHEAHERAHARLRDKIERLFDKDQRRELAAKERSRGTSR